MRAACELPLAEGLKRERALMLELRASPQAAALRHAFFGEREVAQVPGLARDTPVRTVERSKSCAGRHNCANMPFSLFGAWDSHLPQTTRGNHFNASCKGDGGTCGVGAARRCL